MEASSSDQSSNENDKIIASSTDNDDRISAASSTCQLRCSVESSDTSRISGSSHVSVCIANSSNIPESSSQIIERYPICTMPNECTGSSNVESHPHSINLQVQASDSTSDIIGDMPFASSSTLASPVDVSTSTSIVVRDIPQHDVGLTNQNVINIVGSSDASEVKEEIQSSDIQPSCHSELSWQQTSLEDLNSDPGATSQDAANSDNDNLVQYAISHVQPGEEHQTHFTSDGYSEIHYQLSRTADSGIIYSSVSSYPTQQPEYSQSYNDINSLADSYHQNTPSSSGIQMFGSLHESSQVESSTEDCGKEAVSSKDVAQQQTVNSEAEAVDYTLSSDHVERPSIVSELDSTTDPSTTVRINADVADSSTVEISNSLPEVSAIESATTSGMLDQPVNMATRRLCVSYNDADYVAVSNEFVVSSNAEQPIGTIVHAANMDAISTTTIHHYPSSIITMDDYHSTSNSQFVVGNIGSQNFCEINDDHHRGLIQQQSLMAAMLQPARSFDEGQLEISEAERRQLIVTLPMSATNSLVSLPTYVTSSVHASDVDAVVTTAQDGDPMPNSSSIELSATLASDTGELNPNFMTGAQVPARILNFTIPASTENVEVVDVKAAASTLSLQSENEQKTINSEGTIVNDSDQSSSSFWCEECCATYVDECSIHRIQTIFDKPVLSRAWASLPGSYLSIDKLTDNRDGSSQYGVFTKKSIPKRTQFGPMEGILIKLSDSLDRGGLQLFLEDEEGVPYSLDTSNEETSNWMRFVRKADSLDEMNLMLVQQGQFLFFITTKAINAKTELKVSYSSNYAEKWGVHCLDSSQQNTDKSWPCFECDLQFANSEELQRHLNEHDSNAGSESPRNKKRKGKTLVVNSVGENIDSSSPEVSIKKIRLPPKKAKADADQQFETTNIFVTNSCDNANNVDNNQIMQKCQLSPFSNSRQDDGDISLSPHNKNSSSITDKVDSSAQDGRHVCNVCNKVFPRIFSLKRHQILLHSGEKKYKCPICDTRFAHVYNRNRHILKHKALQGTENNPNLMKSLFKRQQTGGSEWLCTHCNLTFDNSSLLNLHTLTHAAENVSMIDGGASGTDSNSSQLSVNGVNGDSAVEKSVHKCPQCTEKFSTKNDLIQHASVHGKVIRSKKSIENNTKANKPYKCIMCYKSFGAFESLQKHMLVHGSDDAKPLQCEICLKRFLNNSALSCHVKIHSGEKKVFECPICKQVYEHVTTLKDHIHVHCVNGVFTCPSCLKKFKEYTQVRKHIRAFHSDKEFPCNQCDKVFPRPDKLKLHLLRHSDHREFLCSDCGKQFKRKDKLKEHTKRMHSGERPVNQKNTTKATKPSSSKKFIPKVSPTDYHRFIYKCHQCLLGFKRRGMLVNHLAKCHPDVSPTSVPELNLPILKTTRDYYCQYCNKVYKSSSKRKSHIVKNHPGADLPMSNRRKGGIPEIPGLPNPTYSQTVGSVTTFPHYCDWCYKQYASKAKLLQHQRKKHDDMIAVSCVTKQLPESMVQVNSPIHSSILINASAITGQQDQTPIGNPPTGQSRQSELVLTTKKGKVSLLSSTAVPTGISVPRLQYVDKHSNIVTHISATDAAQSDLLTQAMSELTQSISAAAVVGDVSADSEYLHLVPSTVSVANTDVMVASPSIDVSTPVPVTTLSHDSTLSPQSTLEQSMLVHLLTRPYDQPASINVQNASTGTQTPHIMNDDSESPDANISRIIDDTEYVPTEHEDLTQSEPTLAMTATSNPSTPLVIQEDQAVLTAADINSNIPIKEESHDISDVEQEMSNCDTWSSANYNEYPAQ